MIYNQNPYQPYQQSPAYTPPATFPQRPMYQQPVYQQPMMQDGAIQARIVSCKEEAIAAPVQPGVRTLFLDPTHGAVYSKLIDPQTGVSDFRDYLEPQQPTPSAPEYVTVEMFDQFQQGLERRFEALTAPAKRTTKGAIADD